MGETELKQGREIRTGGNLVYVDSAAVRAVKHGRILILEGVEKAERGIMPVCRTTLRYNSLPNECGICRSSTISSRTEKCKFVLQQLAQLTLIQAYRNLDDGSHIVHPHRYAILDQGETDATAFIPAHKDFRVIAIAAPVPPYPGYPLDPPFRSRFQVRFVDPMGSLLALPASNTHVPEGDLYGKLRDIILSTQIASESRHTLDAVARSSLPAFPQTSLSKAKTLLSAFPPPAHLSAEQLARLVLSLHPALIHSPFIAWAMLSHQFEEAGLGSLGPPSLSGDDDEVGLLGYRLIRIVKLDNQSVELSFESLSGSTVTHTVPGGPHQCLGFPFTNPEMLGFTPSSRFMGLLTSLLQVHVLGWDISYVPPALPSTASCSTSLLVRTFSALLGYDLEDVHMYKELGGRELIMRRKVENGGATSWEPRYVPT